MEKLFVPYEIALQLKEKGFDEFCIGLFNEEGLQYDGEIYSFPFHNSLTKEGAVDPSIVAAPLYQQVIDWFREKHHTIINLEYDFHTYDIRVYNGDKSIHLISKLHKGAKYLFTEYYPTLNRAIKEALKLIP